MKLSEYGLSKNQPAEVLLYTEYNEIAGKAVIYMNPSSSTMSDDEDAINYDPHIIIYPVFEVDGVKYTFSIKDKNGNVLHYMDLCESIGIRGTYYPSRTLFKRINQALFYLKTNSVLDLVVNTNMIKSEIVQDIRNHYETTFNLGIDTIRYDIKLPMIIKNNNPDIPTTLPFLFPGIITASERKFYIVADSKNKPFLVQSSKRIKSDDMVIPEDILDGDIFELEEVEIK